MKSAFVILITLLTLASCSKDSNESNPAIASELQSYFDDFAQEGRARGINIDYSTIDISAYVTQIEETGVVGQCARYSNGMAEVTVDQPFWRVATQWQRELVMFHELGHCILHLDHNDASGQGNRCESIMHSGTTQNCNMVYNANTRSEMLDELFEQ